MDYCVYLTIYRGNKMPPFYIGRSRIKNIDRGTVSSKLYKDIWLQELADNPQLFETKILTKHSTQKEAAEKEEYFHKKLRVHKNPLYINQATAAGTFHADIRGHKNPWYNKNRSGESNPMHGKTHSVESRKKMSESQKGKHSGKKTEAHKNAIRNALKGRSLIELHGEEMAEIIRNKLKKPKSQEQKLKQSFIMKNKPKLECQHCGTLTSLTNHKRWHGDNCKLSPKKLSNKL